MTWSRAKDLPTLRGVALSRFEGDGGPVSGRVRRIVQARGTPPTTTAAWNFSQGCTTGWHNAYLRPSAERALGLTAWGRRA